MKTFFKLLTGIILLTFLPLNLIFAQYTNFRLYPSVSNQIEPSVIRHPLNPQILFASAFTVKSSFTSEGIYVSTNGGLNWSGTDTCTGYNPDNHGGDPGPIIDKDGKFLLTHRGKYILGIYANYSSNLGNTWSNSYQIAGDDQDKGGPCTDDYPASPYYGRTYLVWTRYTPPYPIVTSYTTNSGVSWSSVIQINNNPGHISQGPAAVCSFNGKVYAAWAASILSSPFTEDYIGMAISSNGGASWSVTENIYDCNGIKTSSLQPWGIRVNSYPSIDIDKSGGTRHGWIYILTAEKDLPPAGSDPDAIFHRSTDGGATWSAGVRVNQDPLNNGKVQYFPAVKVDDNGGINVIYYDNRNVTSDSMEVYLSRSVDGGVSWHDYKIIDHRFRPQAIVGVGAGNQGDNIGMTAANNKLIPVWMDNSSGVYQVWTAIIDINSIGIRKLGEQTPEHFYLSQNYPNPFNPATKIHFSIPLSKGARGMNLRLIIYDVMGREVNTLINCKLNPGSYEVEWDGSNYPSGVYFYQLITENYVQTRKMILLK